MSDEISEREPASSQPGPVFVVGSYRSGTSILTWAIGAHPHFQPLEETGWIGPYGAGALAGYDVVQGSPRNFFEIYGVSRDEYMAHVGASIDGFIAKATARGTPAIERRRWVDGTPENTNYILLLRQLYPTAKFILLVRDPIDAVASMVHFDRAGGVARSIRLSARTWSTLTLNGLLAYRAFGPDVVKIVPYAELAGNPAVVLKSIFQFLSDADAPEAEAMMNQRINSSHVTREERESIQARIERSAFGKQLRLRYDEVLTAMAAPWSRDEQALLELERVLHLPTSAFGLPRHAFVRWAAGAIRERLIAMLTR